MVYTRKQIKLSKNQSERWTVETVVAETMDTIGKCGLEYTWKREENSPQEDSGDKNKTWRDSDLINNVLSRLSRCSRSATNENNTIELMNERM